MARQGTKQWYFDKFSGVEESVYGVTLRDGSIFWKCRFDDNHLAKSVPGYRFHRESESWKYPATPAVAREIVRVAGSYPVAVEIWRMAEQINRAQVAKTAEDLEDHPSKTSSWTHQKRAYWFLENLPAGMLAMEMRTGKTKVAVDLIANKEYKRVLVVAPKNVVDNEVWPDEIKTHCINPDIQCVTLTGSVKDKANIMETMMKKLPDTPMVFITNYESTWREPLANTLLNAGLDLVILDESHRIKSPGSNVSKFFARLGRRVPHRLALTGTMAPNSPLDVYAQYRFLDPGIFGTNFRDFRSRYAVMGGYGGYQILGYRVKPTLPNGDPNPYFDPHIDREYTEKVHSIAFRVRQDEVFDVPPSADIVRHCILSTRARNLYEQLEKEMLAELEGGEISVDNALTKILRLRQITSGHAPVADEDEEITIQVVDTSKRTLLRDILEDFSSDEPVVVFGEYHHDLDVVHEVAKELGRTSAELSGRKTQLKEWQRGEYTILAVQIRAGGAGVDLSRSRYAIYYTHCFSLGDYEQSRARILGSKQKYPTTFFHLVAEGTVDEQVVTALRNKADVVQYIVDEMKR